MPCAPRLSRPAVSAIGRTPATSRTAPAGSRRANSPAMRQRWRSASAARVRRHREAATRGRGGGGGVGGSGRRGGGDVRLERAVGGPAVEVGDVAGGPDRPCERRADPGDAQQRSDRDGRERDQPERPEGQAERDVDERQERALDAAGQLERGEGGVGVDAHGVSTSTSPVPESAWIENGASSADVTPPTWRWPPSVSASTRYRRAGLCPPWGGRETGWGRAGPPARAPRGRRRGRSRSGEQDVLACTSPDS